jgi:hypothetical protein
MMQEDFKYLNIPALLDRKSWVTAGDSIVEDMTWSHVFSDRLFHMVMFFRDYDLLTREIPHDISALVLLFSDFTEDGQQLIKSGAPDKWLASFDRNPEKISTNVSMMARKLKAIRRTHGSGVRPDIRT